MTSGPATWSGHPFLADIISHAAWLYHLSPFSGYCGETGSWCDPPFSTPDRLFRFQRAFAKFLQAVSKQSGDALQEAGGAGGAFAVHEEFDNPAVLRIALASWPPMSMMVLVLRLSACSPIAWHDIRSRSV